MKCPHCEAEHETISHMFNTPVLEWLGFYGTSANSVTSCCGKIVLVGTLTTYHIRKACADQTEDDWGNEVSE